jgi:hypothetical protein
MNYIKRHWRGELSLPQSFWVNGVLVLVVAGVSGPWIDALIRNDYWILAGGFLAFLTWSWQAVGRASSWRCVWIATVVVSLYWLMVIVVSLALSAAFAVTVFAHAEPVARPPSGEIRAAVSPSVPDSPAAAAAQPSPSALSDFLVRRPPPIQNSSSARPPSLFWGVMRH